MAEHSLKLCQRKKMPMSVILFDLNKFKLINDEYGHHEGDFVLNRFAEVMQHVFRQSDVIGRLGGDEFGILLTDLAHNLLADFHHRALAGSRFQDYGPKRIIRDLLRMPGKLTFCDGNIAKIELLSQKQFSQDLLICLERYCSGS